MLRKNKLIAAQKEYVDSLAYIDMYHSPTCWCTGADARREFAKLRSETARREALKEQIWIR
eukprot:12057475-Ditylum_brightwellii.AAC.1